MQAAASWLEEIEVPPDYEDGAVVFPEGKLEMPLEEYASLYAMCPHDAQMRAMQIGVLTCYLNSSGFWNTYRRAALAPVLRIMALVTGRADYLEVPWEK